MTDAEYVFNQTSRERKRNGYGDYHKKRRGGKHVRLSSDHLSEKEWKNLNGEIITYELDKPRTYIEYKKLPNHIKIDYLNHLYDKYDAKPIMIYKMLGISKTSLETEYKRLGFNRSSKRCHITKPTKDAWNKFVGAEEEEKTLTALAKKTVETPVDTIIESIPEKMPLAELISALTGTGAKLTIELTL